MKRTEPVHVAVAETSVIVRSGLVAVLKRMPDLTIQPVEITSLEGLQNCMQGHQPDILIINPTFGGWFNVDEFKSNYPQASTKCVSLLCSVTDTNLLKGYDESIALYDDIEVLNKKLVDLMNLGVDETDGEQETLSQREKEIICCVVRGMTSNGVIMITTKKGKSHKLNFRIGVKQGMYTPPNTPKPRKVSGNQIRCCSIGMLR